MESENWRLQRYLYGVSYPTVPMCTRVSEIPGWLLLHQPGSVVGGFAIMYRFLSTGDYQITTSFPFVITRPHFPYGFTPVPYSPW